MEEVEEENIEVQDDNEEEQEAEEEEEEEEVVEERKLPELRSRNCDTYSQLFFKSHTSRRVDLFWIDYQGERVKYKTFDPGEEYDVTTFVTHPWIFRDAETCAVLHGNGQEVYMPEETNDDIPRRVVNINIPVYSLQDRCIEEYCKENPDTDLKQLLLSPYLKVDIVAHRLNKDVVCELYELYED